MAKRAFPFGRKLKAQVDHIPKGTVTAVQTTQAGRYGAPVVSVTFSFRLQNASSASIKRHEGYILFAAIQGSSTLVWLSFVFRHMIPVLRLHEILVTANKCNVRDLFLLTTFSFYTLIVIHAVPH